MESRTRRRAGTIGHRASRVVRRASYGGPRRGRA